MLDDPVRISTFIALLKHPIRLRLLAALEGRERSATQLADELGVSFDTANTALRALRRAKIVEIVREERASARSNTLRRIYVTRTTGWAEFAESLSRSMDELFPRD